MKYLLILLLVGMTAAPKMTVASTLASTQAGKILLQVEQNGEAWYVNPKTGMRHFLYKPEQAYQVMREEGVGITTQDLENIQIGYYQLTGNDQDEDGLTDDMEKAIGTNSALYDTDGDTFSDGEEIQNGYDPLGTGIAKGDISFAKKQKGKIFLQVESHGEAWWVNPDDHKRYYLGRKDDAFSLMRAFGLGITTANLSKIPVTATMMNCQHDFDCLIAALELNQQAFAERDSATDVLGFWLAIATDAVATNMTIDGYQYQSVRKSLTASLTEESYEEGLQEGLTPEQMKELVEQTTKEWQEFVGQKTDCTFASKSKLLTYLLQVKKGLSASFTDLNTGISTVKEIDTGEELGECVIS